MPKAEYTTGHPALYIFPLGGCVKLNNGGAPTGNLRQRIVLHVGWAYGVPEGTYGLIPHGRSPIVLEHGDVLRVVNHDETGTRLTVNRVV